MAGPVVNWLPDGDGVMNTTTIQAAGAIRTVTTVDACKLQAGDVFTTQKGERLTVRDVETFGACTIVEFTDNTATAPIPALSPVRVERVQGGAL